MKPCPFCGVEMVIRNAKLQNGKYRYMPEPKGKNSLYGYHKRGCQLGNIVYFSNNPMTKKAAIEKWNRRAEVK